MIRFATSRLSSQTVGQQPFHLRHLALPAVLLVAIFGLTTQAFQGERGWTGWNALTAQKTERQAELATLLAGNDQLQQQVSRLGNDSLDLDYLDERARLVLGLTEKDEKVIISD